MTSEKTDHSSPHYGPDNPSGLIALVPPRFGDDVLGGAEDMIADLARGLHGRGWDVEILTTCARDHFTWENHYPPGVEIHDGITVRRFSTVTDTDGFHRQAIGDRILAGEAIDLSEQFLWINDSLRVPDLWHYVLDHCDEYRAIILGPYMFWTTFAVGQIAPAKTILWACIHDEPPARLEIFQPLINGSRGILLQTDPELDLANEIFNLPARHSVVGAGVAVPDSYDPEGFRGKFSLDGDFVYYAGRREWGKGWFDLLGAFVELVKTTSSELTLVTSGVGPVDVPEGLEGRIVDLGLLSNADRDSAMAAASLYVQPSALEAFSLTIMEAWLAGTPVLGNAASEVVAWHCRRSGAGVTYRNYSELFEALDLLSTNPEVFQAIAAGGRDYVLNNYRKADVLDRIEHCVDDWTVAP